MMILVIYSRLGSGITLGLRHLSRSIIDYTHRDSLSGPTPLEKAGNRNFPRQHYCFSNHSLCVGHRKEQ